MYLFLPVCVKNGLRHRSPGHEHYASEKSVCGVPGHRQLSIATRSCSTRALPLPSLLPVHWTSRYIPCWRKTAGVGGGGVFMSGRVSRSRRVAAADSVGRSIRTLASYCQSWASFAFTLLANRFHLVLYSPSGFIQPYLILPATPLTTHLLLLTCCCCCGCCCRGGEDTFDKVGHQTGHG